MKIIAKYPDYYDSIQSMGFDSSLIYKRIPEKINLSFPDEEYWRELLSLYPRFKNNDLVTNAYIIGFCGKIYAGVELNITIKNRWGDDKTKIIHVYSYEELERTLKKYRLKSELEIIRRKEKSFIARNNKERILEYFTPELKDQRVEKIFFDNKVPLFVFAGDRKHIQIGTKVSGHGEKFPKYESDGLIINNNLSELEFYKIYDSYFAYQEVQMYLGGVIPRDIPGIVNISDERMLYKKGFNDISFKKVPDTRRRKQKKGKIKR